MEIFRDLEEIREYSRVHRMIGKSIGFVPTMGALHDGHLSLIRRCKSENENTVCSIFVNPTQFGPTEDFSKYPRPIDKDITLLKQENCDILFLPDEKDMYPEPPKMKIEFSGLTDILEGAKRPGHFSGVCLVVSKLYNIVNPDSAYFGQKDFQQLKVIQRLTKELNFNINIIPCPIVREADGLAMSSRNQYLNEEERKQAVGLFITLEFVKQNVKEGSRVADIQKKAEEFIHQFSLLRLDYLEIVSEGDLKLMEKISRNENPVALIAAYCGNTRLIDNSYLFSFPADSADVR